MLSLVADKSVIVLWEGVLDDFLPFEPPAVEWLSMPMPEIVRLEDTDKSVRVL